MITHEVKDVEIIYAEYLVIFKNNKFYFAGFPYEIEIQSNETLRKINDYYINETNKEVRP